MIFAQNKQMNKYINKKNLNFLSLTDTYPSFHFALFFLNLFLNSLFNDMEIMILKNIFF